MPRVLVVDDESDIRSSLRMYLAAHLPGVEVLEAADGAEAMGVAQRLDVDVLLTDYMMPGMDGLALLAAWRQVRPRSRCIMLTAYPDAQVAERATDEHGARVLGKPADPWAIVCAVADGLGMQPMPPWHQGEGVAA